MKKTILFLIILLFATTIYATCDITDTIYMGSTETYTMKGKDYNVTFSSLKNDSGDIYVKFKVNGMSTPDLDDDDEYSFDDLSKITITNILPRSGNNSAQICFNAGLIGYGKGTCSSNKDCNDSNPCTINECDGDPLRCHRKLILWCRDNDGCCPSKCEFEDDSDCEGKCTSNSDCDDNNSSTKDICAITTKRCNYINITECIAEDDFCPGNCTFTSDTDCDECSTNDNCSDNNACTSDTCSGLPKRCSYNTTEGCNFNEECISVGTRTENQFCHTDNTIKPLRTKKELCDNNYECLDNKCTENICKNLSFIKRISNWFKGLFGR